MSARGPQDDLYLVRLKYRSLLCKLAHTRIDGCVELNVAQALRNVAPRMSSLCPVAMALDKQWSPSPPGAAGAIEGAHAVSAGAPPFRSLLGPPGGPRGEATFTPFGVEGSLAMLTALRAFQEYIKMFGL